MNKEARIEKMATVLHDRIIHKTWRAEKVAKELYEIAVPEDYEWISVKDRLPPKTKEYFDCMLVLKVGDSYVIDCGGWVRAVRRKGNSEVESWGWWVKNDWDEGQGCVVQYWMPYPRLPNEIEPKIVSGLIIDEDDI